ncbi:MAG: outer membrane protein assembly factor BamA [Candidatus Omnitrophota bacterium]
MFFFGKTHPRIPNVTSIRRLIPAAATLALVLMSVPGQAEERNVIALEISGNQTIATGRILLFVRTRSNQPYSEITVAEDTKRLMDTGFFSQVVPNVETVPEGIKVTFQVKEQPTIKAINFYGNRHYSKKNLQKEIALTAGQLYDKTKVEETRNKIRDFYLKKGLLFTEVDVDTKDLPPNGIAVNFKIQEGSTARVTKIIIVGNENLKNSKIKKVLKTKERNLFKFILGTFREEALKDDEERIRKIYHRYGFADVKVKGEVKRYKKEMEIVFNIEEGKQYLTGTITFSGDLLFPEVMLEKKSALITDSHYNEELVMKGQSNLISFYREKGYLKCRVEPVPIYNQKTDRVDITYYVSPGNIVDVEEIKITGNTRTKDKVIRREIKVLPGEQFNGAKLKKSIENLKDLNYFDEINVQPEEGSAPDKANISFDVKEKDHTGNLLVGAGYSTVDDFVGFLSIEQTNFDWHNPPSFTGGGQNAKLYGEFGSSSHGYALSFTEPYLRDYPVSAGFDLYDRFHEYDEYHERKTGGDLRFGWRLPGYWRFSLTPRIERIEITDIDANASVDYQNEAGVSDVNSLALGATRDTRNSRLRTTTGTLNDFDFKYAGGPLSGDKDFWKSEYAFSSYHQLPRKFIFSTHTKLAWADGFGDTGDVPIYERYFCGGAKTVRGYEERSLGPLDTSGIPKGGNFLTVENLEITHPLYKDILFLVFFTDIGQSWWKTSDFDLSEFKVGIGTGIRIKIPIFPIPIKIDYGYALDPLPGEDPGRFHFTIDWGF